VAWSCRLLGYAVGFGIMSFLMRILLFAFRSISWYVRSIFLFFPLPVVVVEVGRRLCEDGERMLVDSKSAVVLCVTDRPLYGEKVDGVEECA